MIECQNTLQDDSLIINISHYCYDIAAANYLEVQYSHSKCNHCSPAQSTHNGVKLYCFTLGDKSDCANENMDMNYMYPSLLFYHECTRNTLVLNSVYFM